jgi:nucleoside-diphosphate-sugar epimerase
MIYGAHKLMMEIALADFSRRGALDGVAVRLPGIVPRPRAPSGMKSAYLSEIFHALRAGEGFTAPVSPQATSWLMSVSRVAENLRLAAKVEGEALPPGRAFTLPALRVGMAELAVAIAAATGADATAVSYAPDATLEPQFGRQPPLATPVADRLGFRHDGDVASLVRQALADAAQ